MFIFGFICGALAGVFTMTTICCLVVAEKEAEVDYLHEQLSEQLREAEECDLKARLNKCYGLLYYDTDSIKCLNEEGSYEEYKRNI